MTITELANAMQELSERLDWIILKLDEQQEDLRRIDERIDAIVG